MTNEQEIFKVACGMDEEQESNSIIRVEAKILHLADGGSEETVSELTLDGPCVNIHRSFRYTMIDLQFEDARDPDFIRLSDMLKDFTTTEQSMDVENDRIPALVLTIMPTALDGEYYICGMHGTWCLMPSEAGLFADIVRFIFDNELVHAYQINTDELSDDEEDYAGEEGSTEDFMDSERGEDTEDEEG